MGGMIDVREKKGFFLAPHSNYTILYLVFFMSRANVLLWGRGPYRGNMLHCAQRFSYGASGGTRASDVSPPADVRPSIDCDCCISCVRCPQDPRPSDFGDGEGGAGAQGHVMCNGSLVPTLERCEGTGPSGRLGRGTRTQDPSADMRECSPTPRHLPIRLLPCA